MNGKFVCNNVLDLCTQGNSGMSSILPEKGDGMASDLSATCQYGTSHGDPFPKQVTINTSKEILVSSRSNYQQGLKTDCDLQLLCEDGENGSPDGGNELFPGRTDSPTAHEDAAVGHTFLKGFNIEARSTIAALFHSWARKPAFQDPNRLLSKVGFAIDERLRSKNIKNKDVLIALKCSLKDAAALAYAHNAIKWGELPPEERALLQAERQVHHIHTFKYPNFVLPGGSV
jgi:hypothetical protein